MVENFWSKKIDLKKIGRFFGQKKYDLKTIWSTCFFDQQIDHFFFRSTFFWTKKFRQLFLFDDFQKKSTIFFSMAAIFRPKSAKMSTQGNAPNSANSHLHSKSRLILCGMNRLPVLTNFGAIPLPTRQNPWKGYTYTRQGVQLFTASSARGALENTLCV